MDKYDEEMANNSPLPSELVMEIFSRVPAKPVLQFKCLSKEWLNIISNPSFIKRHVSKSIQANSSGTLIVHHDTTLYTLDFSNPNFCATKLYYPENINLPQPSRFRLIDSCNGLLFIEFANQFALYNPVTQAHKIIPHHNLGEQLQHHLGEQAYKNPKFVFAYDCVSDDYKILRFEGETSGCYVRILLYTLSTNSWEIIRNRNWKQDSVHLPGVVANNSIYWMGLEYQCIKCFDLFHQNFSEMPLPEKINPGYKPKLAVLGGRLYIVTCYLDIWKPEESNAQESCWTRVFHCPSSQWNILYTFRYSLLQCWGAVSFSLACSEDGSKILLAHVRGPPNFICCDIESQEANMIEVPGLTGNRFSAILPWTGSLVSLSE